MKYTALVAISSNTRCHGKRREKEIKENNILYQALIELSIIRPLMNDVADLVDETG